MPIFNPTNYPLVTPVSADTVLVRQTASGRIKSVLVSALANAASPMSLAFNIAELKAIALDGLSDGALAQVAGYYSPSDGGGGQFYYDQLSSATDNGGTIIAPDGGSGRWIRSIPEGYLDIRWFGAREGATVDATDAFQAAIDAAQTTGFGEVHFSGEYLVSDTLIITGNDITIAGDGPTASSLGRTDDYGDTFYIAPPGGTGSIQNVNLRDFRCFQSGDMTNGAHIHALSLFNSNLENLQLSNAYIGLRMVSCVANNITNLMADSGPLFTVFHAGSCSISLERQASGINCSELFFSNINTHGDENTANSKVQFGLVISSADGLWFENCHFSFVRSASAVIVQVNDDDTIAGLEFSNVWFDGGAYCLSLSANNTASGFLGFSNFSNCLFVGARNDGLKVDDPDWRGLSFAGCQFGRNGDHGAHFTRCNGKVSFSGCHFFDNNTSNGSSGAGCLIEGTTNGVTFGACQFYLDNAVSFQKYGISLAGTCDNIVANGCFFSGNLTAEVSNGTTGTALMFTGCTTAAGILGVAAPISGDMDIPLIAEIATVSGANAIGSISTISTTKGRKVTLIFTAAQTVNDTNNLKLTGTFSANADDTLTLACNGTNWYEIARSAN